MISRHRYLSNLVRLRLIALVAVGSAIATAQIQAAELPDFDQHIKPILEERCFSCHADGSDEGGLALDDLISADDSPQASETWYRVLKLLQADRMPPPEEEQPTAEQQAAIVGWIKYAALAIDPDNPDPGHVTVRRLNQVEYRNTIRDLLDVDFDTTANFPADDTGHGFDNIGDVLSLSPLLLEKYVNAAEEIVSSVVPTVPGIIRERSLDGDQFVRQQRPVIDSRQESIAGQGDRREESGRRGRPGDGNSADTFSYYEAATSHAVLNVDIAGEYLLRLNLQALETYVDNQFDTNQCRFQFSIDDKPLLRETFVRQGGKDFRYEFDLSLTPGAHQLVASVEPLSTDPQIRNLRLRIESVDLVGPQDPQHFVKPDHYERFFPTSVPHGAAQRRAYAAELLEDFATRAFRRPVDQPTVQRLVDLAERVYSGRGATFESGVAKAMTAILASPRFLFREEGIIDNGAEKYPLIDEFALASRLSYFLWSSTPDEELIRLAQDRTLRDRLDQQIDRMLSDQRAQALSQNFVGQWLRSRAMDTIQINARAVNAREPSPLDPDGDVRRKRFFTLFRKGDQRTPQEDREYARERESFLRSFGQGPRLELSGQLRDAMRRETEMHFAHLVKHDLSLLDLIDCDYAFLNDDLWAHYEIEGLDEVQGDQMRLVQLPPDSLRGGVLTQGTFLVVTSNPDRTSPVKRGLFILENLLGSPPSAPPPNIPALEDVESDDEQELTLRETLAIHRRDALCASCHDRMDPLGLALENFNALGRYRTAELNQPIEAAGSLGQGQDFSTVRDMKRILVDHHKTEIYRCIAEKMMTYALGRSIEYSDAHTIDQLVSSLEANQGRVSSLIDGIIHSNAFQRTHHDSD